MIQEDPSKTGIVLIGVSQYDSEDLFENMPAIENNLKVLHQYFTPYQVKVVPIRTPATSHELNEKLRQIVKDYPNGLTVYFAGHAVLKNGSLFLCVKETSEEVSENNALVDTQIAEILGLSAAKKKLLILDCCHAGSLTNHNFLATSLEKVTSTNPVITTAGQRAIYCMGACTEKQFAGGARNGNLTPFTEALLTAMRQGPDRGDEHLSVEKVFARLSKVFDVQRANEPNTPTPVCSLTGSNMSIVLASREISDDNDDAVVMRAALSGNLVHGELPPIVEEQKRVLAAFYRFQIASELERLVTVVQSGLEKLAETLALPNGTIELWKNFPQPMYPVENCRRWLDALMIGDLKSSRIAQLLLLPTLDAIGDCWEQLHTAKNLGESTNPDQQIDLDSNRNLYQQAQDMVNPLIPKVINCLNQAKQTANDSRDCLIGGRDEGLTKRRDIWWGCAVENSQEKPSDNQQESLYRVDQTGKKSSFYRLDQKGGPSFDGSAPLGALETFLDGLAMVVYDLDQIGQEIAREKDMTDEGVKNTQQTVERVIFSALRHTHSVRKYLMRVRAVGKPSSLANEGLNQMEKLCDEADEILEDLRVEYLLTIEGSNDEAQEKTEASEECFQDLNDQNFVDRCEREDAKCRRLDNALADKYQVDRAKQFKQGSEVFLTGGARLHRLLVAKEQQLPSEPKKREPD